MVAICAAERRNTRRIWRRADTPSRVVYIAEKTRAQQGDVVNYFWHNIGGDINQTKGLAELAVWNENHAKSLPFVMEFFFFFFVGIERTKTRFYSFFADRKPRPFRPRFDHLRPKQYRRFRACKFAHFVTHKSVSRHNIVTKICRLNLKKKYINFD